MVSSDDSLRLRFVVPGDPEQNTGGYRYVRRLAGAIATAGVPTEVTGLSGSFPRPDERAVSEMNRYLERCPDDGVVVLDGLAMSGMPEVIGRHAERLRLVALIHHPLADETGLTQADASWFFQQEQRALAVVRQVITTSAFTARRLADFGIEARRITVAEPGLAMSAGPQRAQAIANSVPRILYVGHLSPRKAQHQLVTALRNLRDLPWQCTLAGALDRDREYSQQVVTAIESAGLGERIDLVGEANDERLAELYRNADLFVLPSFYEGYGMVIDEAIAAGLPIISSDVGALADTAGRPGICQYPAGDIEALSDRLGAWLRNPDELARNTALALQQSRLLRTWEQTAETVLAAIDVKQPATGSAFDGRWLELREPADHRARSAALTDALNQWLQAYQAHIVGGRSEVPMTIADLGSGRGSNAVYLSSHLKLSHRWVLLDHDASLLAEAQTRLAARGVEASVAKQWLSAESLSRHIPEDTALITASALIDLVSEAWLSALAETARTRGAAVLVVLSYSGEFCLDPAHPDDDRVLALVNEHQRGQKGTGQALGPDAADALSQCLQAAGYRVETRSSPWRLDSTNAALIGQLMDGWVAAASDLIPTSGTSDQVWLRDWLTDRQRTLADGTLSVTVQHTDLLALPGEECL